MVPSRNLSFKIIPGRLFLGSPTYMEGIQCTGIWVSIVIMVTQLFVPGIAALLTSLWLLNNVFFLAGTSKGQTFLVDPNGEIKLADFDMAKHVHLSYPINRSLLPEYWGQFQYKSIQLSQNNNVLKQSKSEINAVYVMLVMKINFDFHIFEPQNIIRF